MFRVFSDKPLVLAYAVDGLTYRNNRLERVTAYGVPVNPEAKLFDITDSDRVVMEPPKEITGAAPAK